MAADQDILVLEILTPHLERAEAAFRQATAAAALGRGVILFFAGPAVILATEKGLNRARRSMGTSASAVRQRQNFLGIADIGVYLEAIRSLDIRLVADLDDVKDYGCQAGDFLQNPPVTLKSRALLIAETHKVAWMVF